MHRLTDHAPAPQGQDRPEQTRQTSRLKVPAMYTLIRVRYTGEERYRWTGHIYDVSANGIRFEIDGPIDAGTEIEIRAMLPGSTQTTFRAVGRVVRLHTDSEDSQGPISMGMTFERFASEAEQKRLMSYLDDRGLTLAA